ncbi:MAG: hypothetical protein ABI834_09010 [Ginsengibacter sp.]
MKNLLLFTFCTFFILKDLKAQVPTAMPPDANVFYNNAIPVIRPQIKDIVLHTASSVKHYKANVDSLSQKLRNYNILKGMNNNDIEGITILIMVQASKDADADLKHLVLDMSRSNQQKREKRSTIQTVSVNNVENKNSSAEEINDMQNLKLQKIMDRKSRMAEEISYIMQKISGTELSIINDLK